MSEGYEVPLSYRAVSSTKCSSSSEWSEWSCTIVQFSWTQAYVILLQQEQFALRSITSSDVHEQDWLRHPVDPYHTLLEVLTIHTYLVHEGRNKQRYRVHTTVYISLFSRPRGAGLATTV